MTKPQIYTRRLVASVMILLQIAFYPSVALAETTDTTPPADTTTTQTTPPADPPAPETPPLPATPPVVDPTPAAPAPQNVQGPGKPNGAAGNSFHWNPATGLWENDYFTWDQKTQSTKPKKTPVYTYNPATGLWEGVEYMWDAPSGSYKPFVVSLSYNPNPPKTTAKIGNTGQGSNNAVNSSTSTSGTFNNYSTAGITNFVSSTAASGSALLQANTNAGSASTGDATNIANILNLLQSSWSPHGGETATFVINIDGKVSGDLTIDPTGPDSNNQLNVNNDSTFDTTIQNEGNITNNITLDSQTGDATVDSNTNAGDATTGDAHAVANVVNVVGSMIETDKSFIGTININGDFDGDILLPPDMLNYLIAHSGPNSTNTVDSNGTNTLDVNVANTTNIENNVDATASSGNATSSGNTTAGDATTGSADTNVTILNLTGSEIIGDNAMLVFINVHGQWVGAIVNAPEGSRAAALANTGPNSTNGINQNNTTSSTLDIDNTTNITNNIDVNAQSGDASVTNNTTAGSAKSGKATSGVNIANITSSTLHLKKWFGVLFINVFGSWNGSFGVNTAAGNAAATGGMGGGTAASSASASSTSNVVTTAVRSSNFASGTTATTTPTESKVLSDTSGEKKPEDKPVVASTNTAQSRANFWWAIGGITFAVALLGVERFLTFRKR